MSRDAACLHVCLLFRLRLRGFVFVVHAAKEVLAVRHVSVVVVVVVVVVLSWNLALKPKRTPHLLLHDLCELVH